VTGPPDMLTIIRKTAISSGLPYALMLFLAACGGGGGGMSGGGGAPPSTAKIAYPSPVYSFTVGVPAQTITPKVTSGSASSWSVSPALPAGLTLDASNGEITGTPTTAAAATNYTVTASGGTATLALTVAAGPLLDFGHVSSLYLVRMSGNTVLSQDLSNHWVLWNYSTGAELASNAPCGNCSRSFVDMAGSTAVMQTSTGLEVRSASDGTVLSEITAAPAWWMLAADGSYVAAGSTTGLTLWSPSGTLLFTMTGDYSKALAYAAPGQIQVALGPAGTNVIQTIAVPGPRTAASARGGYTAPLRSSRISRC
jgi:Putative Ig domain